MEMMFAAAVLGLGFLIVAVVMYACFQGVTGLVIVSILYSLIAGLFPLPLVQGLGTAAVASLCRWKNVDWQKFTALSLLVWALGIWSGFASTAGRRAELHALRAENPIESLTERLAYEQDRALPKVPELSPITQLQLVRYEKIDTSTNSREFVLASLHSESVEDFLIARGFGMIRMRGVSRRMLDLPEAIPIKQPELLTTDERERWSGPYKNRLVVEALLEAETISSDPLETIHHLGRFDFLHPARMGFVESIDHIIGFQSHRFSRLPVSLDSAPKPWEVERLELVSLMKHASPRVYLSEHLPRMEELATAPTRELTVFEAQSLEMLRLSQDLVVDERSADELQMLGALRANNTCQKCHSVQPGELLGALSYQLRRTSDLQTGQSENNLLIAHPD